MNYRWHQHGRFFHIDTPKTTILLQEPTWVWVMDFLEFSPTLEINGQWEHGTLSQFCLKKGTMSAKWITHCWLLEPKSIMEIVVFSDIHLLDLVIWWSKQAILIFKFIMNFLSPKKIIINKYKEGGEHPQMICHEILKLMLQITLFWGEYWKSYILSWVFFTGPIIYVGTLVSIMIKNIYKSCQSSVYFVSLFA